HCGQHDRASADRRRAIERALGAPRLALCLLEASRIWLRVGEAERVDRGDVLRKVVEAPLVQKLCESFAHGEPEVVVAFRADAEVALQPLVVDEGVARRAPGPLN